VSADPGPVAELEERRHYSNQYQTERKEKKKSSSDAHFIATPAVDLKKKGKGEKETTLRRCAKRGRRGEDKGSFCEKHILLGASTLRGGEKWGKGRRRLFVEFATSAHEGRKGRGGGKRQSVAGLECLTKGKVHGSAVLDHTGKGEKKKGDGTRPTTCSCGCGCPKGKRGGKESREGVPLYRVCACGRRGGREGKAML